MMNANRLALSNSLYILVTLKVRVTVETSQNINIYLKCVSKILLRKINYTLLSIVH